MEQKYKYPTNLKSFQKGTKYQLQDFNGEWSAITEITRMCNETKETLIYYINKGKVRIIIEE
jgi:tryptophan synthase beta subunit